MNKIANIRQIPRRVYSMVNRSFSSISDTPVEEPPRDPNASTRDNTNGGDQSPKPNRNNSNNNQDPNQVPKSPKKDR
ncbi:unnamed protein product [Adineta ricciae]|uniref:Uncharacterized protein n=1 Tax=Adineta ricciae TaxID=249248 RepID=A0A813QNP8_ADIRI|nr:unnamed protein product [Adineta ricciae]CAF0770802.1 unnamed protein product [Adineta ricciae]